MADSLSALLTESRESISYIIREITHICKTMKSRAPGSANELEAAEYLAADAQTSSLRLSGPIPPLSTAISGSPRPLTRLPPSASS